MRVLVVGAKPGSLGAAVVEAGEQYGWEMVTAGVSGEPLRLDLVHMMPGELNAAVVGVAPDHVVCTAGINHPREAYQGAAHWYAEHFNANVIGPMRLLNAFLLNDRSEMPWRHFVAISSNSAHIPRTNSAAYCSSKAALSMALRVRAREAASANENLSVYGYEPGLLAGTPMTDEVEERLGPGVPLTRMKGQAQHGLSVHPLAAHITHNIAFGGPELNGVLLRLDAGEV